ncbi:MAG: type II toxin-antitoxin system mRNA interferase toxin, RelE/StbE family [Dehalococcoidia bacterium]
MDEPTPYTFETADVFLRGLDSLEPAHLNKVMAFLRDHVRYTPTTLIPGNLKALKGTWKGYYEFHVSRSLRLRYWVDEDARVVRLRYLGRHSEWRRSADKQNR